MRVYESGEESSLTDVWDCLWCRFTERQSPACGCSAKGRCEDRVDTMHDEATDLREKMDNTEVDPMLVSDVSSRKPKSIDRLDDSTGDQEGDITVTEVSQSKVLNPPDGGWGWLVVVGCFLMNLIVNGTSYSFGVIFMELKSNYERTSADIAWVYSLNCITCSWLGPLATALSNAFSFRTVVVAGGLIYSVGIVASSFVTKLEQLYITYGLISGFGSALVYGPSIIMVGRYFDKHRSLANGFSVSGSGVGSFLLPPILNLLFDHYGIKGAILILGAFSFHLCIAGMLYRPVPLKKMPRKPKFIIDDPLHEQPHEATTVVIRIHPVPSAAKSLAPVSSHASIKEEMYETALYPTRGAGALVLGASVLSIPENIVTIEHHNTSGRLRHISGAGVTKYGRRFLLALYAWPRNLRSGINSGSLFDFSLLKDRLFLMFSFSVMLASFGYVSVYLILPTHAQDLHVGKGEAVYLISVMAVGDLIGRISFGWFSDFNFIPRKWGFCAMILMAALGNFLVVFATTWLQLAIFAGWFGFFAGSFMVLNAVLTADLFGLDKLPSAIGLLITIQGIAYFVGPPLVGLIKDRTGSFLSAFSVIFVVMIAGACLLPLEAAISQLTGKRKRLLSGKSSASSDDTTVSEVTSRKDLKN